MSVQLVASIKSYGSSVDGGLSYLPKATNSASHHPIMFGHLGL